MKSAFNSFYKNYKEYILFAILLLISISLLTINADSKIRKFKAIAFGHFAIVSAGVSEIIDWSEDSKDFKKLQELNAKLTLENTLLKSRVIENNKLRAMLGFKNQKLYPLIAGEVVSKHGSVFNGQFIINLGTRDSITKGMPVITEKGIVGMVTNVSDKFSTVNHIYNSEFNVAVTFAENNTEGILSWNGRTLIVRNIPTTTHVEKDYKVITSDFSTIFPAKIPVGKVSRVESSAAGLLSDIVIVPFEDIESVGNIFVMKINKQELFLNTTPNTSKDKEE